MRRRATLRSLAKLNLDLRVLGQRADGFHELRTVFQTISLADTLAVEFEPLRLKTSRTSVEMEASSGGQMLEIPDNLIVRAARVVLDAVKVRAHVRFKLEKRIPVGGGLGGGSSNAAAVLLALPVLAGRNVPYEELMEMGAALGSDVPFFLEGGTAVAVDRGTEIYGLPDVAEEPVVVLASGIHVATGEAYRSLGRGTVGAGGQTAHSAGAGRSPARRDQDGKLTCPDLSRKINTFQSFVRALEDTRSANAASAFSANDFEPVVFGRHPQLKLLAARLRKVAGQQAAGVRMTGSGSALFAIFGSKTARDAVAGAMEKSLQKDRVFGGCRVIPAAVVSRANYRRMWRRQLAGHAVPNNSLWPPQSRHER